MSTPSPALPIEIVDKILQTLKHSSDIPCLKACSLVSNFFLPLARRYLFQDVVLYLTVASVGSIPHVHHNCLHFLSNDIHVASFIRSLSIIPHPPHVRLLDKKICGTSSGTSSVQTSIHCQPPVPFETAVNLIDTLRQKATTLTDLFIHSNILNDWTSIDMRLRSAVLAFCNVTTLRHLELQYLGVSAGELEHLVGPNSSLSALSLRGVHHAKPGTPCSSIPAPRSVETLEQQNIIPLQLDILLESSGSSSLMIPLVHKAGQRLASLKWRSNPGLGTIKATALWVRNHTKTFRTVDEDTYFHLLDLRHLTALEEITIGLPFRSNAGLDELNGFLSGKKSIRDITSADARGDLLFETRLRSITLEFDCRILPTEQVYSSWNWCLLDKILSTRHSVGSNRHHSKDIHSSAEPNLYTVSLSAHPCLQSVVLAVKCIPTNPARPALVDQLFEIFQRNLPQATSRGLLKRQQEMSCKTN